MKLIMIPYYKHISPSVSVDGVRMINSGYDTKAIVSANNVRDKQKKGRTKMNKC